MIGLYESILADIEDTLDLGDVKVPLIMANAPKSDLRNYFCIYNNSVDPFKCEKVDGKFRFYIDYHNTMTRLGNETSKKIANIFGDKVYTIVNDGAVQIESEDISNDIAKEIFAATIHLRSTNIENVKLIAEPTNKCKLIPNINIKSGADSAKVTNCNLETNHSICKLGEIIVTGGIPKFKNVKSTSFKRINISNEEPIKIVNIKPVKADLWKDSRWNNIFEFGGTISYDSENDSFKTATKTVKVKDMNSYLSLIRGRDYYSRSYNKYPYTLKKGAKLSDLIDISGFDSLDTIHIFDNKMGVFFYKVNTPKNAWNAFFVDMLKPSWNPNYDGYSKTTIKDKIPVTDDGYMVIIYRR